MPTYDYVCDACEHGFELFQSIKAEPETKCPERGKRKLRRLRGNMLRVVPLNWLISVGTKQGRVLSPEPV